MHAYTHTITFIYSLDKCALSQSMSKIQGVGVCVYMYVYRGDHYLIKKTHIDLGLTDCPTLYMTFN